MHVRFAALQGSNCWDYVMSYVLCPCGAAQLYDEYRAHSLMLKEAELQRTTWRRRRRLPALIEEDENEEQETGV